MWRINRNNNNNKDYTENLVQIKSKIRVQTKPTYSHLTHSLQRNIYYLVELREERQSFLTLK